MVYFPIALDPEYGFEIPSYNAREAIKTIAQSYVRGSVLAKPAALRQKLKNDSQYSAQVLVLGDRVSVEPIRQLITVGKTAPTIRLFDPKIKAWIRMDEDTPTGANPLFIVRSEENLLAEVERFFQGFIKVAQNRGT